MPTTQTVLDSLSELANFRREDVSIDPAWASKEEGFFGTYKSSYEIIVKEQWVHLYPIVNVTITTEGAENLSLPGERNYATQVQEFLGALAQDMPYEGHVEPIWSMPLVTLRSKVLTAISGLASAIDLEVERNLAWNPSNPTDNSFGKLGKSTIYLQYVNKTLYACIAGWLKEV